MDRRLPPRPALEACTQVRLAQSELVSIDKCSCGALRVHLGAEVAGGLASICDASSRSLA